MFDLLYLDGDAISSAPLKRKERLRGLLSNAGSPLQYSDHQIGRGPEFYARACELSLEGIISKRADALYAPGNRGLWVKVKCMNREEFVVVGWTDHWRRQVLGPQSVSACHWMKSTARGWFSPTACNPSTWLICRVTD
jgi:ATP-dependent DNA ligase